MSEQPYTYEEIASVLVKEPFNLPLRDIARLNDYQVMHIFFRPCDEKTGRLIRPKATIPQDERSQRIREIYATAAPGRERHFAFLRAHGLAEEDILERWQEFVRKNPKANGVTEEDRKEAGCGS